MYWPLGVASVFTVPSPGTISSEDPAGDGDRSLPFLALSTSRPGNLLVTVSAQELFVWQTQVRLTLLLRKFD
jgi:hypothetical protein